MTYTTNTYTATATVPAWLAAENLLADTRRYNFDEKIRLDAEVREDWRVAALALIPELPYHFSPHRGRLQTLVATLNSADRHAAELAVNPPVAPPRPA